jgi:hypothetical protein
VLEVQCTPPAGRGPERARLLALMEED